MAKCVEKQPVVCTKVSDKAFFDKRIVFYMRCSSATTTGRYNVLYRDGKNGPILMKRCAIKGVTHNKVQITGEKADDRNFRDKPFSAGAEKEGQRTYTDKQEGNRCV